MSIFSRKRNTSRSSLRNFGKRIGSEGSELFIGKTISTKTQGKFRTGTIIGGKGGIFGSVKVRFSDTGKVEKVDVIEILSDEALGK
jgi:hypothetical protein